METYNPDQNPFENVPSGASSAFKVDVASPPSPEQQPSNEASVDAQPVSPTLERPFPSHGSHKQSPGFSKTEFCCACDQTLHSGDELELLVSNYICGPEHQPVSSLLDYGCPEDVNKLFKSVHHVHNQDWSTCCHFLPMCPMLMPLPSTGKHTTVTRNLNRFGQT